VLLLNLESERQGNFLDAARMKECDDRVARNTQGNLYCQAIERQIDDERRRLKKIARSRLETGANVKAELLYIDLVRQIEKIGDRCFGIAGELAKNTTAPQAS
jgi:uncharacterized protein Yka (UPF0111/DUF47 family)